MGLDLFVCEICKEAYTEYERGYCKGCDGYICECCAEGLETNEYGEIIECENCNAEEMITISKERYDELIDAEYFLNCLHGAGVDNWNGYSDAQEMFEEEDE